MYIRLAPLANRAVGVVFFVPRNWQVMVDNDDEESISIEKLQKTWLQRARGVLVGQYGSNQAVEIYGLWLQRVDGNSQYYDVAYPTDGDDDKHVYVDTIDIGQFSSARQIVKKMKSYYPDESKVPEEPEEDESSTVDRSGPAFQ